MSDTTIIIKQVFSDSLRFDTINSKLTAIQSTVQDAGISPSFEISIPLLSSIIGGVLVLAGQAIERHRRRNLERENNLLEIYAYCRKLESLMKNNYRELAMAKTHVEYWWHCCNSSTSEKDKARFYEEHLKSQAFAREIEKRIGEHKADFIGHIRKFQAIKFFNGDSERLLETISNLTNSKAKAYDFSIPHEKLRYELVEKDEQELRILYYNNLNSFKILNNKLQELIKKK